MEFGLDRQEQYFLSFNAWILISLPSISHLKERVEHLMIPRKAYILVCTILFSLAFTFEAVEILFGPAAVLDGLALK